MKAVFEVDSHQKALYRLAQLALRVAVGSRDLDVLLAEKDSLAAGLEARCASTTPPSTLSSYRPEVAEPSWSCAAARVLRRSASAWSCPGGAPVGEDGNQVDKRWMVSG